MLQRFLSVGNVLYCIVLNKMIKTAYWPSTKSGRQTDFAVVGF